MPKVFDPDCRRVELVLDEEVGIIVPLEYMYDELDEEALVAMDPFA